MMQPNLTLPLTVQRGAVMQLLAPMLLAEPLLFGAVFYILWQSGAADGVVLGSAFGACVIGSGVAVMVLLKALRPATISIDKSSVTVRPLPILGQTMRSGGDFSTTQFRKIAVKGPACVLQAKDGAQRDIRFSPPRGLTAAQCAEQLNRLLGYGH